METWLEYLQVVILAVTSLCHLLAMLVILIGVAKAFRGYLHAVTNKLQSRTAFRQGRMELGHAFSLALGILIGASILNTAIAPNWTAIGQLAAIIAIRIVLNHFLLREVRLDEQNGVLTIDKGG